MKKILFLSFILLIGVFFCIQNSVSAQESDLFLGEEAVVVANVELQNVSFIEKIDRMTRLTFEIVNAGETVQPDIRYSVQLVEKTVISEEEGITNNYVVDERVYDEVIDLNPGESALRDVVYDIPTVFSGEYALMIHVTTTSGTPLALAELEDLIIEDPRSGAFLDACIVSVEGDNTEYGIAHGVDIDVSEKLFIACDVSNLNSESITFSPQFISHKGDIFGEIVDQSTLDIENLSGGEKRNMRWQVPTQRSPQVYDASLQLINDGGVVLSNSVPVHYVVRGESGTILNAQLDQDHYQQGETAKIFFDIAGRADLFFGSRLHGENVPDIEPQKVYYDAMIRDKSDALCGEIKDQEVNDFVGLVENNIAITKECLDPVVSVMLLNTEKEILDEAEFALTSDVGERSQKSEKVAGSVDWVQMIFYSVLIATFIGVVVIILMRKKTNGGINAFIGLCIVGGGLLFTSNASALTFTVPPPAPWGALGYAMYITASASPQCDATQTKITGTAKIKVCRNAWAKGSVFIDGSRVLYKYCPKGASSANCGTYSFSKWDNSRVGNNSASVKGLYELNDSKWNQSRTQTLYYTVNACPPREECGSANGRTFTSQPTSNLCNAGALRWIDTTAADGTWNWKCGSKNCYANRERTLGGTLSANAECLPQDGNGTIDLSIGSITGTAVGAIEYRYSCNGGSSYSAWTSSNTYQCSYPSIGNKSVRAQIRRDGVTANTNSLTVNITLCPVDGACNTNAPYEYSAEQSTWPSTENSYFCLSGTPTIIPTASNYPDYGGAVTWGCNGIGGGNSTPATECSARRLEPASACGGNSSGTEVNSSTDITEPCAPNNSLQGAITLDTSDGYWRWDCMHDYYAGSTDSSNYADPQCQAPSCLANSPLNLQRYVYFDGDGNPNNANVNVQCPGRDICCEIDGQDIEIGGEQKNFICTGEQGEITVPSGGRTYTARCWFEDEPENPVEHPELAVGTMCTARSCGSQGMCQSTPQVASSPSDCSSTCTSNADCSRGRMIETRP